MAPSVEDAQRLGARQGGSEVPPGERHGAAGCNDHVNILPRHKNVLFLWTHFKTFFY